MSLTQNKLNNSTLYTAKHIIVAFSTTEDALNTPLDAKIGKVGTVFNGKSCGQKAVVVINELDDDRFVVMKVVSRYYFNSMFNPYTTTMSGEIQIVDPIAGYFQDFLRKEVASVLNLAESHIIYALKTFFFTNSPSYESNIIQVKPLIFHTYTINNSFYGEMDNNSYTMPFLADYNGYGLLPNYSKMYQMTVSNVSGVTSNNFINSQNVDINSLTTAEENQMNTASFDSRIKANEPMRYIEDLMNGLQYELNSQISPNKAELQKFLTIINNDYTAKINPPVQKNGDLPLEFTIDLDSKYNNYAVDNRNLPFEQIEQSQNSIGLGTYQIEPGRNISQEITRLMNMSQQVGIDVGETPSKTFKINCSVVKTCSKKYKINYKIAKYTVPENIDKNTDTGPGDGAVWPLEFSFGNLNNDSNVLSITTNLLSDFSVAPLEKDSGNPNSKSVLGNREQVTISRTPDGDFFSSGYSGVRSMADSKYYGLENGEQASQLHNMLVTNLSQTSTVGLWTVGNPDLLSDLYRSPIAVQNNDADNPKFYKFVESYPMYAKLKIYFNEAVNKQSNLKIPNQTFYNTYYNIGVVESVIEANLFTQYLELYRTDNIV